VGTKNNPGDFDCYLNAEPDEPMFVLLARDPDAPRLIESWANNRKRAKPNDPDNDRMVDEALNCALDMEEWRITHRG